MEQTTSCRRGVGGEESAGGVVEGRGRASQGARMNDTWTWTAERGLTVGTGRGGWVEGKREKIGTTVME